MEEIDLDKYRNTWNSEQHFEKKTLTKSDVQRFLKKSSNDISQLFTRSLIIDIVLKSMIGISILILPFTFHLHLDAIVLSSLMIIIIFVSVLYQIKIFKKIPKDDYSLDNVKTLLERKINFYTKKYFRTIYVNALSNPLIFLSGE